MKPAPTIALIALAGLAVAAAVWTTRSATSPGTSSSPASTPTVSADGTRFLAGLSDKVNSVAEIVITRAEFSFTVHRVGDTWRLKEKGDYPVKPETVRQVVLGLADLQASEAKTSRPDMYSKLGVEDPVAPAPDAKDAPTPMSTLVTLKDASGAVLSEVIVGNRKPGSTAATSSVFVRRKGEAQSWQCQGNLDVPRDQMAWLEAQFANLERTRVRSVTVAPGGSDPIQVSRASSADPFKLANTPSGKELKEPNAPENIAGALTYATFMDVSSAASVDFSAADGKPRTFELRTFDGLIVSASCVTKDAKTWWKLGATLDEPTARDHAGKAPDPSKPEENKPTAEQIDAAVAKLKKEVEDLNAKWTGFAFAPQDFKAAPLNSTLAEMLKDPEPAGSNDGTPPTPPSPMPGMPAAPTTPPAAIPTPR